jgi:hypothetical protein
MMFIKIAYRRLVRGLQKELKGSEWIRADATWHAEIRLSTHEREQQDTDRRGSFRYFQREIFEGCMPLVICIVLEAFFALLV